VQPIETSMELELRKELTLRKIQELYEAGEWDELTELSEILVSAWIQQCVVSDWLASEAGVALATKPNEFPR
tara:strand:+ start:213 stop:428 length:216 start_codon:yes stop_codon:yes gene_type:complete